MTAEELKQIKDAAVRIHAAAVKAGKWENKPEWESKLMEIVCDIAGAVEADKNLRRASMRIFDDERTSQYGDFQYSYMGWIAGTVEDCLADAVIDILDTVEGFCPDWVDDIRDHVNAPYEWAFCDNDNFAVLAYNLISLLVLTDHNYGGADIFVIVVRLIQYSEAHGIDLRRHVQLKMEYNEARS